MSDVKLQRLRRKILRRDAKIKGMQRYIQGLERALCQREVGLEPRITRAVQDALCNVRMIPVSVSWRTHRIKVEEFDKEEPI